MPFHFLFRLAASVIGLSMELSVSGAEIFKILKLPVPQNLAVNCRRTYLQQRCWLFIQLAWYSSFWSWKHGLCQRT